MQTLQAWSTDLEGSRLQVTEFSVGSRGVAVLKFTRVGVREVVCIVVLVPLHISMRKARDCFRLEAWK